MCSISGGIFLTDLSRRLLIDTIRNSVDRGRDSWGVAGINTLLRAYVVRKPGTPTAVDLHEAVKEAEIAICNLRAEPTTEWVEKTPNNIQPFDAGEWVVAHNGTVANDKELAKAFGLSPVSAVDSSIIPLLLDYWESQGMDWDACVRMALSQIKGSFAVAIMRKTEPGTLWLACNYKPIYLLEDTYDGWLLFASQREYFHKGGIGDSCKLSRVEPYTIATIDSDGIKIDYSTLAPLTNKNAIVVCSGGMDSTVVAKKAIDLRYNIELLHFTYGCIAEEKEIEAVRRIARRVKTTYRIVDLKQIFQQVTSPLLDPGRTIAPGEAGAEFAHEWVPARNLIMLSVATGIAESCGASKIMLGNNLEESGAYPDNEMEFVNLLNTVMPYAVASNKTVEILMPVGNLMKHEIVRVGTEIDAPLDLTWSCYLGKEKHCGVCGPCYMRRKAYKMNGLKDPMEYLK